MTERPRARHRAVVSELLGGNSPGSLRSGELTLLRSDRVLVGPLASTNLTLIELPLFENLMRATGRVVTEVRLMVAVGTEDWAAFRTMQRVRSRLELVGTERLLVRAGDGYRLAGTAGLLRVAGLELALRNHEARLHGRPLDVPPDEFAWLEQLASEPGRSVATTRAWKGQAPSAAWRLIEAANLLEGTEDGHRIAIERFGLCAVGPLLLDRDAWCVRLFDLEEQLTAKETGALEAVVRAAGDWVAHEVLATAAGARLARGAAAVLGSLRRKLARLARGAQLIAVDAGQARIATERLEALRHP